jgi:hypothetical protein
MQYPELTRAISEALSCVLIRSAGFAPAGVAIGANNIDIPIILKWPALSNLFMSNLFTKTSIRDDNYQ